MKNLAKAILKVMEEVQYLQKNKQVGSGNSSYQSVTGSKVRQTVRDAMMKAGLTILPIGIEYSEDVFRWEEKTNYGLKQKQQVRLTAKTKYLLLHTSGESMELQGLGTGVDSQDKAAGKATSYALKYCLMNLFVIPTGLDPDAIHSDDIPVAPTNKPKKAKAKPKAPEKVEPKKVTKAQFKDLLLYAAKKKENRDAALVNYILTKEQRESLEAMHPASE